MMTFPTGHDEIAAQLRLMADSAKLPHAMLFYGPKGIGKAMMAQEFARFLLCGPRADAGQQSEALFGELDGLVGAEAMNSEAFPLAYDVTHENFPLIEAGSTPDFHFVAPAEGKQSISAEQMRLVLEKLSLSSDHNRLVIVDDAEQMTMAAANVLLKALEEPRPNIYFILVSHTLSKLLPTIISRCRKIHFRPLSGPQMTKILAEKKVELPETMLSCAAGCPGHALFLATEGKEVAQTIDQIFTTQHMDQKQLDLLSKHLKISLNYLLHRVYTLALERKNNSVFSALYTNLNVLVEDSLEYNLSGHLAMSHAMNQVLSALPPQNQGRGGR